MKDELRPDAQKDYFFNIFPLIEKIASRKLLNSERDYGEDIAQDVKLSLLRWQAKRPDRVLSQDEWLPYVNRATVNRIKTFRKEHPNSIPLSSINENEICRPVQPNPQHTQIEGNTIMELHLLVSQMWDVIQTQTFFEHYALLLKNAELTSSLIMYRACRMKDVAERLRWIQDEFDTIIERLPFNDREIASFLAERFQMDATPAAIRKARQRATQELQAAVKKDQSTKKDGKPSEHGRT